MRKALKYGTAELSGSHGRQTVGVESTSDGFPRSGERGYDPTISGDKALRVEKTFVAEDFFAFQ